MAKDNWPNVALEPEQILANTFASDRGLTIPVDVESIFKDHADVELDDIPGTADAVLIRRENRKPLLVVSRKLESTSRVNRYRFTLAHELGHILIPWQLGTMLCHASITYHAEDFLHQRIETEANRFAAELLVPHVWAAEWMQESDLALAPRILDMCKAARVSSEVGVITAAHVCPADCMILLLDAGNRVTLSAVSPESIFLKVPGQGDLVELSKLSTLGSISQAEVGDRLLVGVDCSAASVAEHYPCPNERSTDILKSILDEIEPEGEARQRLLWSINGVVGYANTKAAGVLDVGGILNKLRLRFIGRDDLSHVTGHASFRLFLVAKAHELAKRR